MMEFIGFVLFCSTLFNFVCLIAAAQTEHGAPDTSLAWRGVSGWLTVLMIACVAYPLAYYAFVGKMP